MSTLAARARGQSLTRPIEEARGAMVLPRAREAAAVGAAVFLLSLAVGLYLSFQTHYAAGDAFSRMANAYYVLFSRDPHFAAIGFVWNPLPSILELPLVALHGMWPAVVTRGVAAIAVSSVFAGLSAYFLCQIAAGLGIAAGWRVGIALAFALNPLILLFSGNGMSEMMFIGTLLGALDGVLRYLGGGALRNLTAGAVWLAISFLIRYEAVPIAAFLGLGVLVGLLVARRSRAEVEGALVLLGTPIAYAAAVWIYANWLIMKKPFYFMNSPYGNSAQLKTGIYRQHFAALAQVYHHLAGSLLYAGQFTLMYWPVLLGAALMLVMVAGRWQDPRAPALLGAALGAPILQAILVYRGLSSGVERYYIYYIPLGLVMVVFAVSRLRVAPAIRTLALCLTLLVLISGNASTLLSPFSRGAYAVQQIPFDQAGWSMLINAQRMNNFSARRAVAQYVDRRPKLIVLVDTFIGWPTVISAANPKQFVISSDLNFNSILTNPRGRVTDFLLVNPKKLGRLDAVNRTWPKMWSGNVPWARRVAQFPSTGKPRFRLFAIGPNAP